MGSLLEFLAGLRQAPTYKNNIQGGQTLDYQVHTRWVIYTTLEKHENCTGFTRDVGKHMCANRDIQGAVCISAISRP